MGEKRTADDRRYQRLPPTLRRELGELEERYAVQWDGDNRAVLINGVELPDGFAPGVITITLKLPTAYPQAAPRAKIPWDVRYHARVPRHLLNSGQWLVRGCHLGEPMIFFPTWEQGDSLRTVFNGVLDDLTSIGEAGRALPDS